MRSFVWSFLMLFLLVFSSFSQTIEKGTYISTAKGQQVKLNLLENNKFELVFFSGDYEIKGDSILFGRKESGESVFNLEFKEDKKAKKVKVTFLDPAYYSLYIGTQNGSQAISYQKLSDIQNKVNPNYDQIDLAFEIDRADFLYLVNEGYYGEKTRLSKFALPKDVSEITISYEPYSLESLNLTGVFDKTTNQLNISEKAGRNPLVFINEKEIKTETVSKVKALENQILTSWTYPGKPVNLLTEDFGNSPVIDSAATAAPVVEAYPSNQIDFKLKIENNLKSALSSTKNAGNKYLVVYADSKNASAKTDFEAFVKDQETQTAYNMYDKYNPIYDIFNYYFVGNDDKKWLKANKIDSEPRVVVLNGEGDILADAKSTLSEKQYQFSYYGDFYRKLQRTDALVSLNKLLKSKKASDADLIRFFNKASVLETSYDYDSEYAASDVNSREFVMTKTTLDQKEVNLAWKKLIEAHQKDTKPNMYLVEAIVKEIKNQGFTKQLFNEDRILNDADFLSIDYLLKHATVIETERQAFNVKEGELHLIGNIYSEISSALQQNLYLSQDGVSGEINKDRVIATYKKIAASGNGNFDSYRNYFDYMSQIEDKDGSNTSFLKEFSTYFDTQLASEKESPIERLDALFSKLDSSSSYSYDGWNSFKEYNSNLCNTAAWSVVLKPQNDIFLKSAIRWSEYSLVVTKNNPYYLDTLAQLYYKDGQKEKALETQTLAVKFLNIDVDFQTAEDIRNTLEKMKNGTY
ncbi:hypothetical protein [Flavobacterium foetidum]|uniref:hypothetical protein n=1 Tax=Flavobacterium foetidum TaxID=2026681 RepID=UPI00107564AA|nr:hypothetical protein [Flavobacterium foetidum]KAF2512642.1 hypothetical protein E0W73_16015 [Flavobacterium foetidum]